MLELVFNLTKLFFQRHLTGVYHVLTALALRKCFTYRALPRPTHSRRCLGDYDFSGVNYEYVAKLAFDVYDESEGPFAPPCVAVVNNPPEESPRAGSWGHLLVQRRPKSKLARNALFSVPSFT